MAKAKSVEACFSEIETVINALESGDLPLEESLKHYEKGLALVRQTRAELNAFSGKLETLRAQAAREEDEHVGE